MTWLPNVTGDAIDLVDPRVDQVDFRAMAHALAHLNRYAGHGQIPVSVGLHLLIGLDLCAEPIKPYWLLHDGHEERLGEIPSPTMEALTLVADEIGEDRGASIVRRTVAEFKRRHDAVIHAAAGLPMPSGEIARALKGVDVRCLAIEHRDFQRPSVRPWDHEALGLKPDRSVRRFQAPDKVADQLLARFERYLPALRAGVAA